MKKRTLIADFLAVAVYIGLGLVLLIINNRPTSIEKRFAEIGLFVFIPCSLVSAFWLTWRISMWAASSPATLVRLDNLNRSLRWIIVLFVIVGMALFIARSIHR